MLNKTEQSDCAPNANEKQEDCYCSALPKGSPCLPCYTRWLAGSPRLAQRPARAIKHLGPLAVTLVRADDALGIALTVQNPS
jgi:hypothetical protein